jgi:chaperone required for assembly of F1-ATPase
MTDDRPPSNAVPEFVPVDPYGLSRREAAALKIKRVYAEASVGAEVDRYRVLLDGRPVRTPARNEVALPSRAAAMLVVDEWNRQGEFIQPADMPFTRLTNSVIDGVAAAAGDVLAEIVRYAGSDLLCYRADTPQALVDRQAAEWDPVLDWSRDQLHARFYLAQGVVFVAQPEHALAAVRAAAEAAVGQGKAAPFRLGALHVMTTLTGSALLGLAVLLGELSAESAWHKAHVDEDFQIGRWGEDAEAAERRRRRGGDMSAAAPKIAAVASEA